MERRLRKKAQTPGDAMLAVVFILMLGIGGLVSYYIFDEVFTAFSTDPILNATPESMTAYESMEEVNSKWDWLILFVFVGFAISMVVIGYFIDVHSVFLPLYIIAMVAGVIISAVLAYVWEQVSETAQFALIKDAAFPISNHLLSNLPIYFTVIAALAMIATYAKTKNEPY